MLPFRRPHRILSAVLALAMSFFARAESPSGDGPPLPSLFQADKKYPLEQLSREMYLLDPNPGMTHKDMTRTPQTPSERLEGLRAIWPNVNVWSDAAPLLTEDFRRLAPGPGAGLRPDGDKHVAKSSTDFEWAALNSKISVRDRDTLLDPSRRTTWETDETVKMPVGGPLFLFGQLGASTAAVEEQQHKWLGRTGVGIKLKPWFLEEVQVRGGPVMRYDATSKKAGQAPERSELFLEAVTKLPLPVIGPLKVEYTSFAVAAGTASERGQINQDVKLAKPFRGDNEFHVGAKYHTEDSSSPTPWVDRMQLYMGVQLKR